MKEGDNITILVLGDEGVGKSSFVSTFVSRHFSERGPGILTRVRLPPDPALSKCTTTIVDTQGADAHLSNALASSDTDRESSSTRSSDSSPSADAPDTAATDTDNIEGEDTKVSSTSSKQKSAAELLAATSPFRNVDAAILVYDLDRIETFNRLEEHWLPLIEQCYNEDLPVVVAGNKLDLASDADNQNSPSRQQIISLLQQFKFVRECVKCSATKLANVDEVFRKCQHSVLYPIGPLYDFNGGGLSAACRKAFTRIFRIFDRDNDGLLSDSELNVFQQRIWRVSLTEKDFAGWKRMAMQHSGGEEDDASEEVIRDGMFTLKGFLAIFEVLIAKQNRLEVPWKVLRTLGYDDDVKLAIPESIALGDQSWAEFAHLHPNDWRLSHQDIDFLARTFAQFDSDGDGALSSTDINSIFSVLTIPFPPWCEERKSSFQGCFSRPRVEDEESPLSSPPSSPSSLASAGGITISSSPLPSIELSKDSESIRFDAPLPEHKPLSFLSWMNRWHMVATVSPSVARAEMYRLGNSFETQLPRVLSPSRASPPIKEPSTFVRALVLGSKGSGKRSLVQKVHRLPNSHEVDGEWDHPTTSCSVSKVNRPQSSDTAMLKGEETTVHVIMTEVPALDLSSDAEKNGVRAKLDILLGQRKSGKRPYDMAVLVFDANDAKSWQHVKDIEGSVLTEEMPRVFVGTACEELSGEHQTVTEAYEHCKSCDLEPPLIVSLNEDEKLDSSVLEHLVGCAQDERQVIVPFRSTPHGERKRRVAARRRKALWVSGVVTAGITVVLLTWRRKTKNVSAEGGGWLGLLRKLLPF